MKARPDRLRIIANRRRPRLRLVRFAVQILIARARRVARVAALPRSETKYVELFAGVHVAREGEGGDGAGFGGAVD